MTPAVSIIIPCYNEELRIRATVHRILAYAGVSEFEFEIFFLNDGSTDKTSDILHEFRTTRLQNVTFKVLEWDCNQGKGWAVKQGLLNATGQHILICDADLSTPIEDLNKLTAETERFDVIVGSRRVPGSVITAKQPPIRVFMGKIFSGLSRIILGVPINDFTCGFKLIEGKCARRIGDRMTISRWGYDSELLKIASVLKLRMKEVGVTWAHDSGSKVRLRSDIFSSALELIKVRWNALCGLYAN